MEPHDSTILFYKNMHYPIILLHPKAGLYKGPYRRQCCWVQACNICCRTGQKTQRQVAGVRKSNFIQKASKTEKMVASQNTSLPSVRILASFILKGEGVISNILWFWSNSWGGILISSFLQPFTGEPKQRYFSITLIWEAGFPEMGHYV